MSESAKKKTGSSEDVMREALAAIHDIRKAFGPPGDYGYGSKQGDALVRLYNSSRGLAERIA